MVSGPIRFPGSQAASSPALPATSPARSKVRRLVDVTAPGYPFRNDAGQSMIDRSIAMPSGDFVGPARMFALASGGISMISKA